MGNLYFVYLDYFLGRALYNNVIVKNKPLIKRPQQKTQAKE